MIEYKDGLYICTRPLISSVLPIVKHVVLKAVPNPVILSDYHVTICYSSKAPDPIPKVQYEKALFANNTVIDCQVWETKSGKNCMVLLLESENLKKSHESYMKQYNLSYDYDEYKPHMTISYDCGDTEPLKEFVGTKINFSGIYFEPLDND